MSSPTELILVLIFYAGYFLAAVCMLIATLVPQLGNSIRVCYVVAFLALLAQAGCQHVVREIGSASGSRDSILLDAVFMAAVLVFVWAVILEWRWNRILARKRREETVRHRRD